MTMRLACETNELTGADFLMTPILRSFLPFPA